MTNRQSFKKVLLYKKTTMCQMCEIIDFVVIILNPLHVELQNTTGYFPVTAHPIRVYSLLMSFKMLTKFVNSYFLLRGTGRAGGSCFTEARGDVEDVCLMCRV